MRVAESFSAQWSACWITTYTFDPGYFETFLLRRLGEPPLNATVLADARRLHATWQAIDPGETWRLRRANHDYLVRGVAVPGGAFHAKTLLLGNGRSGVLLVGSGNLTLGGLDHGREVFSRFEWGRPGDDPAFGAWRGWMEQVVALAGDEQARERWADLIGRLPWLPPPGQGTFVTNWSRPLLDQFIEAVDAPTDHLVASAPFFDADLGALSRSIAGTRPGRLTLLVGDGVSVDGGRLRRLLVASDTAWEVRRYLPRGYVHAKILAAITGDSARVLAGSANLSGPALLRTTDGGGNVEAGVIVEGSAAWAAALLALADGSEPVELSEVETFALAPSAPDLGYRCRIGSAHRQPDGCVRVEGATRPTDGLLLAAVAGAWPLDGAVTVEPVPVEPPCLVWLVNAGGEVASNRVPLDDRRALAAALSVRSEAPDRPAEVDPSELDHPLGAILAELYRSTLFSIDESPAASRAETLRAADSAANEAFWETFLRDQIRLDPRHGRYASWRLDATGDPPVDDFRWIIAQMLDRVPPKAGLILLPSGESSRREEREADGKSWSPSAKLAASTFHVLGRWADALADDRVRWYVAEYAPIDHYERLLATIVQIWAQGEAWFGPSSEHRPKFARLLEKVWTAFIGGPTKPGYLESLAPDLRERARELVGTGRSASIAAALAYAALVNARPERFFAWQPFLVPGLEQGVFGVGPSSPEIVLELVGTKPTVEAIDTRLRTAAAYTDDAHWAARIQESLGFASVKRAGAKHPAYGAQVDLEPGVDLLGDPRVVALVREALRYRSPGGVRITSGGDILVIGEGRQASALTAAMGDVASAWPISSADLQELADEGAGFAAVVRGVASA